MQSRMFREVLEGAMLRYTYKQISMVEMIVRLIEIAHFVREERARGQAGDMSQEDTFYDVLAGNGSAARS